MICKVCGAAFNGDKCPVCGYVVEKNNETKVENDGFFDDNTASTQDGQRYNTQGYYPQGGRAKFCSHCGNRIHEEAVVCVHCGCPVEGARTAQQDTQPKSNGMAVAGFVCSFFVPLLGWVFGGIGLAKSKKMGGKGKALSIAAIIIASANWFLNFLLNMGTLLMLS